MLVHNGTQSCLSGELSELRVKATDVDTTVDLLQMRTNETASVQNAFGIFRAARK
jgi:hypothetical protein